VIVVAQNVVNGDECALTRAEFQFHTAYMRFRLGLRVSKPLGSNEGLDGNPVRRLEIEAMVDHVLRDFIR
jgi:hypothetical protein